MIPAEEVDANYAELSARIDRLEELEGEWWARFLRWFRP